MEIIQTFGVYKKQAEDIRNSNEWRKPNVLLQFREQYKGFTDKDVNTLISFLNDDEKKWFVASLLDVLDSFPIELLKPMINAAVNERDPSYNDEFIRPCRRVFGYIDIQQILLEIFQHGDKEKKIGVLKALYWTRQTVYIQIEYIFSEDDTPQQKESKGYEVFQWKPEFEEFDDIFVEDLKVYEKESPKQRAAYQRQIEILITEFFNSFDIELKYHISLRLPKEIDDYPNQIRDQAENYLIEYRRQNIPTTPWSWKLH